MSTRVFALIESQRRGWTDLLVTASLVVGVVGLLAFVTWERRVPRPMLPRSLFANRNFAGANLTTAFATACVRLIVAGTLTDASFARLLQVCAALFFIAAAVGAVTITNPAVPAELVPCEVAGLCRDRHDAHPQLRHAAS